MARFEPHPQRRPAIIAGASSGIGAATATELAARGFPVALGARRVEKCEELAARIRADGGEAVALSLDVTEADSATEFVRRAGETEAMHSDARTTFEVVTTLESAPVTEARFLLDALTERRLPLGAVVVNRVLPKTLGALAARESANQLVERADALAREMAPFIAAEPALVARVLAEVGGRFQDFGVVASRQAERQAELAAMCPLVVPVPWFEQGGDDLTTLARMGMSTWGRT